MGLLSQLKGMIVWLPFDQVKTKKEAAFHPPGNGSLQDNKPYSVSVFETQESVT